MKKSIHNVWNPWLVGLLALVVCLSFAPLPASAAGGGETPHEPGTYRITANLYLPGELNKQLPNVTAYLTNPANPLGIGGHEGIPNTPVADNATMVVGEDGSRMVILDVVNPVFTLQKIGGGTNAHIVDEVRDDAIYSGHTGVSRDGRITQLTIALDDSSGIYSFPDSVEFPTLLEEEWQVPLELGVDFASAVKISDSTAGSLSENPDDSGSPQDNETVIAPDMPEVTIEVPAGAGLIDPDSAETENAEPGSAETGSAETETAESQAPKVKTVSVTRLKPGTYTVTSNIFLSKEDTGLPMNPHLTSGIFPPKDPVSNNATLIVAADGTAKVIVPIPVTVMSLNSVKGLNVVDMEQDDSGAIKSLTIHLGRLDNPKKTMSKGLNVSITLSELAQSISGFEPDHDWPATFELDLNGVPTEQAESTVGATNPKTGDDASFAGYLVLMLVSLGGIGFLIFRRKRSAA